MNLSKLDICVASITVEGNIDSFSDDMNSCTESLMSITFKMHYRKITGINRASELPYIIVHSSNETQLWVSSYIKHINL